MEREKILNWGFYFTTVLTVFTLVLISLIAVPVYVAAYINIKEKKTQEALDFMKGVHEIQKESKLDEAIERIFEEGASE